MEWSTRTVNWLEFVVLTGEETKVCEVLGLPTFGEGMSGNKAVATGFTPPTGTKARSVKEGTVAVCAGAGNDIVDGAAPTAEFGAVGIGENAKLGEGIGRRGRHGGAQERFIV